MASRQVIQTREDLSRLRGLLRKTEARAKAALVAALERESPLRRLKFERLGRDPWDPEDKQNIAEQIDMQATCEVALDAIQYLMEKYPSHTWHVAPGADSGSMPHDILSEDKTIGAEVFAAVRPSNNRKLRKDIARFARSSCAHRYVFYRDAAMVQSEKCLEGVVVVSLGQ